MDDGSLTLRDGRTLGFRCLGDPGGQPLFFFHGTPGSRFVLTSDEPLIRLPGIRWILPERPGYGLSTPKPGRGLLDWPADVSQLADHLEVDTFVVAGESGGGPHALVCAHQLERRVIKTLLLASPSPAGFKGATRGMSFGNKLGLWISRWAPWLIRKTTQGWAATIDRDPEKFFQAIRRQMSPPDRQLMLKEDLKAAIIRDFQEAYRQGGAGHASDAPIALTGRDWGFDLGQITTPVYLWHGEEDVLVTRQMAEYLQREIPQCEAHFVPGAGHLLTEYPEVIEGVRKALEVAPP